MAQRVALQYEASKFAVKVLRILVVCPGATATQIAELVWNNSSGYRPKNTGGYLRTLAERDLIFCSFGSQFWKRGSPFPRKRWYVTEKGFAVYTFYERQKEAKSPYADGARRTCC